MTALGKEQKLRNLLEEKLEQLQPLYSHGLPLFPNQHVEVLTRWQSHVEIILRSYFGPESPQLKQFKEATSGDPSPLRAPDPFVVKAKAALEAILYELKISKELQPVASRFSKALVKVGRWIKAHRILSIIFTILIIGITILGTNWNLVVDNFIRFLGLFR